MKKALTFALAFSCSALWLSRSSFAQDNVTRNAVSVTSESGNREQDKLVGPVRRVRVETARIIPKDGNWVEGPRELLGITTYDPTGKKIDSVAYPVDRNTVSGKEQYRFDQKGNVVEMTLLGSDGSMLSKEAYKYEFDQLGNWTKMSSSVAVYENGKVIFEPTETTYRTISYYYNQAIAKLNATSPKSNGVSTTSVPATVPTSASSDPSRPITPSAPTVSTSQPPAETANAHAKTELVNAPASVTASNNTTAPAESPNATASENRTTPVDAPPTSVVQRVTEEELRSAAIELPKPELSAVALRAQASGKVTVQILVDETGQVVTAQATSGNALLGAAAEAAARQARFSLAKVSPGATRVYGVITYNFESPKPVSETLPTTSAAPINPPPTEKVKPEASPIANAPVAESKPKSPLNYTEAARSSYNKGLTLQSSGLYAQAAEAFKQTIKYDPNDARAYARLGMTYSAMQQHKDAIVVYKMALQIDGNALGSPDYYTWGLTYLALEKHSEALSAFKQALNLASTEAVDPEQKQPPQYPSLELLHYGTGIAYLNLKRFGESIRELRQVTTLNPKNAEAHYAIALAYLSNGNRRQAEVHQRTLSSLNPKLAEKLNASMSIGDLPPGCLSILCRR